MMFENENGIQMLENCPKEEIKAEVEDYDSFSDLTLEELEVNDEVKNAKLNDQCDFKTPFKSTSEHKRVVHKGIAHICDQCDTSLPSKRALTNHMEAKHSDVTFSCDQCSHIAACREYLTDHIRNVHLKPIKDAWKCEFCDYVAKHRATVRSHIQSAHSGINFPCDQCDFIASCKRYLKQHIRFNHTIYQCDLCVFEAKKPNAMKVHLASEHNIIQESHLCEQCSFVALSANALAKHVEDHNPLAFSCTLCDYKTKNTKNLQKHVKDKHKEKTFLCDECDFTTSANYNLVRHTEKVHQGLSFPCAYCGYVAPYRDKMNGHIKSYHGEKHECNQCSFVAKNPRALENHISAEHLGIRYPCPSCAHVSRRKWCLQDHVKRVHKMGPLENSYFEPQEMLKKMLRIDNKKASLLEIIQNAEITQDQKPYFHKQNNEVKVEHNTSRKTPQENSASNNSVPQFVGENVASEFPPKTEEESEVANVSNTEEQDNAVVMDHPESFSPVLEQQTKVEHSDDEDYIWENAENSAVIQETKRKPNTVEVEIFKCDICQKVLSRRDKLITHKLLHKGEKPFTCEVCGNKFLTSVSLKQHSKTHQEGFIRPKLHQCSLCGKSFESLKRLTEHQFSHTGEKAHQCATCGVKYAVIESLNKHMKKHTEENPFPFSRKELSNVTVEEVMPGKDEANVL